jgi:hypothetical protein
MFNDLSFITRAALASVLGSACTVLVLMLTQSPVEAPSASDTAVATTAVAQAR